MPHPAKCLHAFLLLALLVTNGWAQGYLLKNVTVSCSTRIAEEDIVKATELKAESNIFFQMI